MTVSLQYIHRVYGNRLRKIDPSAAVRREERRPNSEPDEDTVHISKTAKKSILTPEASNGISGSILQTKLAIKAYQEIANGLPSMLR